MIQQAKSNTESSLVGIAVKSNSVSKSRFKEEICQCCALTGCWIMNSFNSHVVHLIQEAMTGGAVNNTPLNLMENGLCTMTNSMAGVGAAA